MWSVNFGGEVGRSTPDPLRLRSGQALARLESTPGLRDDAILIWRKHRVFGMTPARWENLELVVHTRTLGLPLRLLIRAHVSLLLRGRHDSRHKEFST